MDSEQKFLGYTLLEAVSQAVDDGSLEAWEWLKAWVKADLTEADPPFDEWVR